MANATTSVIVASASAVAKVFVIGAIGYVSAIRPRPTPILPPHSMNAISKMNFNLLLLPLVYSTLASAATPEKLGSLWFIIVSAIGVICLSYAVASLLGKLPFFKVENKTDFDALRIAAAFPNIVALPILIFPTLCEFPVVYDSFYEGKDESTEAEKFRSCVDESNAMIFIYFFAFNLLYWIIGFPSLVAAGQKRQMNNETLLLVTKPCLLASTFKSDEVDAKIDAQDDVEDEHEQHAISDRISDDGVNKVIQEQSGDEKKQPDKDVREHIHRLLGVFANALMQTVKSPGFIATALGFITACIPPLRDALFSSGGALRFFGSAIESLGSAAASVGTLVVAASLVHQAKDDDDDIAADNAENNIDNAIPASQKTPHNNAELGINTETSEATTSDNELTEQHPRDLRAPMRRRLSSLSQTSNRVMVAIRHQKPTIRMHAWFICSRLIVTPAIVCALIIVMDCGGTLDGIPKLAKMIVIVNSCLPGAQIIVLTLKSKGLSDSASIVAKVYLPSYLLSVVTIAGWSSLGLMISVPSDDGTSLCKR